MLSSQAPQALNGLVPAPLLSGIAPLRAAHSPERISADLLGRRAGVVAARWRGEAAGQGVAQATRPPRVAAAGAAAVDAGGAH